MGRFDQLIGTRRDETGAQIFDITSQLEAQTGEMAVIGATTVEVPIVQGTALFTRGKKNKILVTLQYANFGTARDIKCVLLPRALVLTSGDYDSQRITSKLSVAPFTDDVVALQLVTSSMETLFDPDTQYDFIKLVALGEDGADRAVNAPANDTFAAYPGNVLFTFTTPAAFGAPGSPAANLLLVNRRDLTTKDVTDAEIVVRVHAPLTDAGAAQTWGAAGVDTVVPVFQRLEGTPDAYPLQKVSHLLQGTELTQVDSSGLSVPVSRGYVDIGLKGLAAGAPYSWLRSIAWASGEKIPSGGVAYNFRGANENDDPANLTSVSLTITSTTLPPYDADAVEVKLNYTQPAQVESLKWVKVERKLTSEADSEYKVVIPKFSLKDDQFNIASTAYSIVISSAGGLKTKPNKAYTLRTTITGIGGVQRIFTTNFSTGADGAVASDTAIPTLATNPDTGTTGPTVTERHSKIDIGCPLPSANINTLDNYQVVLQSANTTITGDPVVGVSNVLVIKYGQNPTFNLSYFATFSDQFYVRFRAHNSVGYSVWSAGTNQSGYSRPIQDFIGDAVPDSSEGLVRIGTSGTGHTTTAFVLESGASAVDDFYNGNALQITTPGTSSPNADRWRTIIDYVGSTRTCTVAAYSSAPSGALAYDIHRIGVSGDRAAKSTTGHTTTAFVLESGASAVDDFYNGYTLYIPSMASSANKIRKVEDYVGSTRTCTFTLSPFSVAPSGELGYLLVNGSIGFSTPNNADSLTGVASPVSFRWYLNNQDQLVFETLPPNDQNAFSLTHFQIKSHRRNVAGPLQNDSGAVAIVSGTGYQTAAAVGVVNWASTIRFRNMFRTSGSDGWGSLSYYVAVLTAGGGANYDPELFGGAVVVDYQGESSYPKNRYSQYL